MHPRLYKSVALPVLSLLLALPLAIDGAAQTTAVKAGTLTCTGGEGVGLVLGSTKSYDCRFVNANGTAERYKASVTKIGLDIGVTNKTTMVWSVLGASQALARKALAGSYVGATADASLGLGAGAKVLVGGSGRTITLQPLSLQGQTGVNLAVGVAELSLK